MTLCIVENIMFLCDIMTPNNSDDQYGPDDVCILRKCITFGRTGRSARETEVGQGVFTDGFRVILCGFLDRANEVIERPVPFRLSFENENPIRLRESSFLGDDPGVLKISQACKNLPDLGYFDEVFQLVWSW